MEREREKKVTLSNLVAVDIAWSEVVPVRCDIGFINSVSRSDTAETIGHFGLFLAGHLGERRPPHRRHVYSLPRL